MLNSSSGSSLVIYKTPLECQVISTAPEFIITDKSHKVSCEFTKDAIIAMKQYYPSIRLQDLINRSIILLEYAPYTRLGKKLHILLRVYSFCLIVDQQSVNEVETPREIVRGKGIHFSVNLEVQRHIKMSLLNNVVTDRVPPLEGILMEKISYSNGGSIKYEESKGVAKDYAGRVSYSSRVIEHIEDDLTEAASKLLATQRRSKREQKNLARRLFKRLREKPVSLEKALIKWADSYRAKRKVQPNLKRKDNMNTKTTLQNSDTTFIPDNFSKKEDSGGANVSEMKFNVEEFKEFLNWKAKDHNHDKEDNNVGSVLKQSGDIRISFTHPKSTPMKAFHNWIPKQQMNPPSSYENKKVWFE